jgi:hypothetical protein
MTIADLAGLQWLTYWVVYACMETIETWAGFVLHRCAPACYCHPMSANQVPALVGLDREVTAAKLHTKFGF